MKRAFSKGTLRGLGTYHKIWHLIGMSITGTVENDSIKLPPGVHLPNGTEVEVLLPNKNLTPESQATLYERMKEFIGSIKDGPEDLAAEHDHYAHSTPKREGR